MQNSDNAYVLFHLQIIEDDEFLQVATNHDHRVKIPTEVPLCLDVFRCIQEVSKRCATR